MGRATLLLTVPPAVSPAWWNLTLEARAHHSLQAPAPHSTRRPAPPPSAWRVHPARDAPLPPGAAATVIPPPPSPPWLPAAVVGSDGAGTTVRGGATRVFANGGSAAALASHLCHHHHHHQQAAATRAARSPFLPPAAAARGRWPPPASRLGRTPSPPLPTLFRSVPPLFASPGRQSYATRRPDRCGPTLLSRALTRQRPSRLCLAGRDGPSSPLSRHLYDALVFGSDKEEKHTSSAAAAP